MSSINLLCGVIRNTSPSAQIFAFEHEMGTADSEISNALSKCMTSAKNTTTSIMQRLKIPSTDAWSKQCLQAAVLEQIADNWPTTRSTEIDPSHYLRHVENLASLEMAPEKPALWEDAEFAPTFLATAMGATIRAMSAYARFDLFQIDEQTVAARITSELQAGAIAAAEQCIQKLELDDHAKQQVIQSFLKSAGRIMASAWDATATRYLGEISTQPSDTRIEFIRDTNADWYEGIFSAFHKTMQLGAESAISITISTTQQQALKRPAPAPSPGMC